VDFGTTISSFEKLVNSTCTYRRVDDRLS
jgi:hypothetical protein